MKRIGIFGGSFNPIHVGHLVVAEHAAEVLALDRMLFVPSGITPLKRRSELVPARDRLAMVRAAIRGNPRFEACDVEVRRGGVSYTLDTVRALRRRHPRARFHILLGADSLRLLPEWKDIAELAREVVFVVAPRPHSGAPPRPIKDVQVRVIDSPLVDVSSTGIRRRVRQGRSIRYLVPPAVERIIRRRNLYLR